MSTTQSANTNLVLGLAILFLIWGLFGLMDIQNFTHSGYSTDGNFEIIKVEDGSPAASAGLLVGDLITHFDSIEAADSKTRSRRLRPAVGETRTLTVTRDDYSLEVRITYAAQDSKDRTISYLGWLIGLIYLLIGIWVFTKTKSRAAYLFAIFCLCFGFSFLGDPYFSSYLLRQIEGAIGLSIVLISFAFLVNFLLSFPSRSNFLDKKNSRIILYGPAVFLSLFFIFLILFQPDSTSGLNNAVRFLIGFFVLFYFGWAILTLIRRYSKLSPEERSTSGLSLLFWGAIVGLLPILIVVVLDTINPKINIPGEDYIFLTMGLIPILFGLGILKSNSDKIQ